MFEEVACGIFATISVKGVLFVHRPMVCPYLAVLMESDFTALAAWRLFPAFLPPSAL
jgi:hypothetical protein